MLPLRDFKSVCLSRKTKKHCYTCKANCHPSFISRQSIQISFSFLKNTNPSCVLHLNRPSALSNDSFSIDPINGTGTSSYVVSIHKSSFNDLVNKLGGEKTQIAHDNVNLYSGENLVKTSSVDIKQLPRSIQTLATTAFRILGVSYFLLSSSMIATSLGYLPTTWLGSCFPQNSGSTGVTARIFLGLAAGSLLRAAASFFPLQTALAGQGHLVSWKLQRLSLGLGFFGLLSSAAAAVPSTSSLGFLKMLVTALGLSTAAATFWIAYQQHQIQPFISPYLEGRSVPEMASTLLRLIHDDFKSLSSSLAYFTAAVALIATGSILFTSSGGLPSAATAAAALYHRIGYPVTSPGHALLKGSAMMQGISTAAAAATTITASTNASLLAVQVSYPSSTAVLRRMLVSSFPLLAVQLFFLLDFSRLAVQRSQVKDVESRILRRLYESSYKRSTKAGSEKNVSQGSSKAQDLILSHQPSIRRSLMYGGVGLPSLVQLFFVVRALMNPVVLIDLDPKLWQAVGITALVAAIHSLVLVPHGIGYETVWQVISGKLRTVWKIGIWIVEHLIVSSRWITFFRHSKPL
uniref:Uncharacterized protein n=1 Tax=Polytomella parva TaxID=51329 RepID=A0A7S0YE90_9CHLO|mmetsp:Transcript_13313/g.23573  ORF Transcript_13313/g.23573 Transcript_13313/m.23573 type:complete len:576 (+) Transcript_13313:104-1831(+)